MSGTFAQLSAADQASLIAFMTLIRPLAIKHQQALNNVSLAIQPQYSLNVFNILNSLTPSELISDNSGLNGALQMSAADIMSIVQDFESLLTEDTAGGTGRSVRRVKAGGGNNMLGS